MSDTPLTHLEVLMLVERLSAEGPVEIEREINIPADNVSYARRWVEVREGSEYPERFFAAYQYCSSGWSIYGVRRKQS